MNNRFTKILIMIDIFILILFTINSSNLPSLFEQLMFIFTAFISTHFVIYSIINLHLKEIEVNEK